MRAALLSLPFVLLAAPAFAQGMPNSLNMTCSATRAMVQQQGAVVIATGPNVYQRYVADQRYCDYGEETYPAWIQTQDQSQCYVGMECKQPMHSDR
ncbi:hypothetical protein MKI84_12645 [Ancylobacter sp. A5.8]|uniref:hypothetical protein n=1 Tax=Ancylobacter gelatini TaxID=2919920 RepID=UPI001F4E9A53|nr:hypothetical protein [Ancylobacter gelatini]MCJ8143765.1 hypothetical protein [Ancylobacter gelatini]